MKEYCNELLDNGLSYGETNADEIWLVKNPVANDAINNAFAALDAKRVASATIGAPDKSISAYASGRQLTTAAKTDAAADASSVGGDDLHFVLANRAGSKIIAITDETTDQVITVNNQVNLPAINWKIAQPA